MDNVLVINDYSRTSLNVFDYTASIFKNKNVKISLFDISEGNDKEVKQLMFNKRTLFERKYKLDNEVDLLLQLGQIIDKKLIDIIVLATKFNQEEKGKFIGDKVSKVIAAGFGVPIIIVPHDYQFLHLQKITFLTDFKREFNSHELREFIKVALMFNSTIDVFNYSSELNLSAIQEKNNKSFEAYLEDLEIHYDSFEDSNANLFSIKEYMKDLDSQMISFVNHERVFFKKLIDDNGIYFEDFYSKVPILLLPSIHGNLT